ncbi:unnamed protein product [Malus baccata var. baccata]
MLCNYNPSARPSVEHLAKSLFDPCILQETQFFRSFLHLGSFILRVCIRMSKMVAPRSSSGSNPGSDQCSNQEISMNKSEPLIPGLPDEVAELCLLYLPYPYQALVRSVSASWNRAITGPSFVLCKKNCLAPRMPANNCFSFRPLRTNHEAETQDRKERKADRQRSKRSRKP